MKKDFCEAKYRTASSVSDLLTRGAMKKDFCEAKYRTASSVSDFLTRGVMKKDFCEAKYRTALNTGIYNPLLLRRFLCETGVRPLIPSRSGAPPTSIKSAHIPQNERSLETWI